MSTTDVTKVGHRQIVDVIRKAGEPLRLHAVGVIHVPQNNQPQQGKKNKTLEKFSFDILKT